MTTKDAAKDDCPACRKDKAKACYRARVKGKPARVCESCWQSTTVAPYGRPRHVGRRQEAA